MKQVEIYGKKFNVSIFPRDMNAFFNSIYLLERYGQAYFEFMKANLNKVFTKEIDAHIEEYFRKLAQSEFDFQTASTGDSEWGS